MNDKIEAAFPFAGFYETTHERNVADAISNFLFNKNYEEVKENEEIDAVWEYNRKNKVEIEYCKEYVISVCKEYGFKTVEFKEMTSPREYNFMTDGIFVMMDKTELKTIIASLDMDKLRERVKKNHSSCPGFTSFVENDLAKWDLVTLDLNCWQVETILEEHIAENYKGHNFWEFDLYAYHPDEFDI
ncbi:MAG: hypothetical protein WC455_10510 [Dehalococcoidia bacterium]|jgi:hypothetical protein